MHVYETVDRAYQDLLRKILKEGQRKENRTGVDTLSIFGHSYQVDISEKFPLLTLKDMGGSVFESLVAEMIWYLSGEHHIRNLKEHSKIWNEWADEDDNLDFAYGRMWRRYPVPELKDQLPGEEWATGNKKAMDKYVREEKRQGPTGRERIVLVFDQISYILDTLKNNPFSRRMVLNAWHPANCAVANPPACHCMAVFNVEDDKNTLNCHLTLRSNDVGLGHPFNIAQYSMLTYLLADQVGMKPGRVSYNGVDAHLYIGDGDETEQYDQIEYAEKILDRGWIERESPELDFVSRDGLDEYKVNDFSLKSYNPYPHIGMKTVP